MTNKNIKTLDDLHTELYRLKADYNQRSEQLKLDSKAYIHQFTLGSLLKKFATPSAFLKLDEKTHISSKIMSIALPMLMNMTVFRGSGFITKSVGALVTRKLGKSLDAESLSGMFNAVKSLFNGKKSKTRDLQKKVAFVDYGIPPDSETY